jgi:hypothetical protein
MRVRMRRKEGTNDQELGSSGDRGGTREELGGGVDGAKTLARGEGVGSSDNLGEGEAGTGPALEPHT